MAMKPLSPQILTPEQVDAWAERLAKAAVMGKPGYFGWLLVSLMLNRVIVHHYADIGNIVLRMACLLSKRDDLIW
jgi:hypothetical protein